MNDIIEEISKEKYTDLSLNKKDCLLMPWPTRKNEAISEFTTRYFFTMAFPFLFPYATADLNTIRGRTCQSMSEWTDHLLWYDDGRVARHKYLKFIVHNMISRKKVLENGQFILSQKLGDKLIELTDLKQRLQAGDKSVAEKVPYFSSSLRGTSQYWNQRSREFRAMIQYKINEERWIPPQ